jgi:hypothetical protein
MGHQLNIEQTLAKMLLDRARLAESVAKLDHDIAALRRILAEYGGDLADPGAAPAPLPAALIAPVSSVVIKTERAFDGTFASLIRSYRSNERSPYHNLQHKVRISYDNALDRLVNEIGDERLDDWDAPEIQSRYDKWTAGGRRIAAGHNIIGKLRLLSSFGSVVLNDERCTRISTILSNMRFPGARVRTQILTRDHARAIRAAAHEQFNWPSIALAQAFQFDLPRLKQVGVIGEWVPLSEPGTSEITKGNEKWVRGLRWSDIDENMILRKVIRTGRQDQPKEFKFNVGRAAMIMEEINRVPPAKRTGPIIICEYSGLPWITTEFRRKWRKVADKAGVPKDVKNMDSARSDVDEEPDEHAEDLPYMK